MIQAEADALGNVVGGFQAPVLHVDNTGGDLEPLHQERQQFYFGHFSIGELQYQLLAGQRGHGRHHAPETPVRTGPSGIVAKANMYGPTSTNVREHRIDCGGALFGPEVVGWMGKGRLVELDEISTRCCQGLYLVAYDARGCIEHGFAADSGGIDGAGKGQRSGKGDLEGAIGG